MLDVHYSDALYNVCLVRACFRVFLFWYYRVVGFILFGFVDVEVLYTSSRTHRPLVGRFLDICVDIYMYRQSCFLFFFFYYNFYEVRYTSNLGQTIPRTIESTGAFRVR